MFNEWGERDLEIAELKEQIKAWERSYQTLCRNSEEGNNALQELDDAWDAIGTAADRKHLTLAEAISTLLHEK
jgi:bisphosphoglycerate-dependent phosphoglycerate mutase